MAEKATPVWNRDDITAAEKKSGWDTDEPVSLRLV